MDQNKIRLYQKVLKLPFWEIRQAAFYLTGIVEFADAILIDQRYQKILGLKKYGIIPREWEDNFFLEKEKWVLPEKRFTSLLEILIAHVHANKILSILYKTATHSFPKPMDEGMTYFIKGKDAINIALIEGYNLPIELTTLLGIRQHKIPPKARKNGFINETMRLVIAKIILLENPKITEKNPLVRKVSSLKMAFRKAYPDSVRKKAKKHPPKNSISLDFSIQNFEFINGNSPDSPNPKARIIGSVIGKDLDVLRDTPEGFSFDFKNLFIALNIIAFYMRTVRKYTTYEELLDYKLIKEWISCGGPFVREFVDFSLSQVHEELYYLNNPDF